MSSGFVSESDLEERRRIQKEIWQSNKTEDDPDEPPEEPIQDHRTLFDRLKEQKDKKQEEWEEAHKLKNMVRGLEDDEVDFLEFVDNTKLQEEKRIRQEEVSALKEYRKKVSAMQQKAIETEVLSELKPESKRTSSGGTKKTSQISLLAGAIKRKRSETDADDESKKIKDKTDANNEFKKVKASDEEKSPTEAEPKSPTKPVTIMSNPGLQCVAILPGLGVYTDSSDSDNDSNSDSDIDSGSKVMLPRDITGRIIQCQLPTGGKGCC